MNRDKLLEYFNGSELSTDVWLSKYQYGDEKTPDDMHRRLAREFYRVEKKYIDGRKESDKIKMSNYGYNRPDLTEEDIYNLFKDFKYIIPGGSVNAILGTPILSSLSNCFLGDLPEDNYRSIMDVRTQQTSISKYRGGFGTSLELLRPRGAKVNNSAKTSTGSASFMEGFSTINNEIAQGGRRAALMLSHHINHPDAEEFIVAKQDLTKVTGANISVKVTNEFIRAVKDKKEVYVQTYPIDRNMYSEIVPEDLGEFEYGKLYEGKKRGTYYKVINPVQLWSTLMNCAYSTAEPGIMFEDHFLDYAPDGNYEEHRFRGTNPCVTGDTLLLTKEGYKRFDEAIDKPQEIWNGYQWSNVTPFKTSDSADVYRVIFSNGVELKCTEYHKFVLENGERKELKDLQVGDRLVRFEYPVIEGVKSENDRDAYTIGFFCGDGTIAKGENRKRRLFIDLYSEKYGLLDKLNVREYGAFSVKQNRQRTILELDNKSLEDSLSKAFVFDEQYTVKTRLSYLSGLLDSDGTINSSDGNISITSCNKEYLTSIQLLLTTLGVGSTLSLYKKEEYKAIGDGVYFTKNNYRILISSFNVTKLISLGLKCNRVELFANTTVDRSRFITIRSIEKLEDQEPTYCLTEPVNHTMVVNGIITSQCGEVPLPPLDSCRLISIILSSYVVNPFTDNAYFDEEKFYCHVYELGRLIDNLVDLEVECIQKIIDKNKLDYKNTGSHFSKSEYELWERIRDKGLSGRRTGQGITALGDMLAYMGIKYDSDEALKTIEHIMRIFFKASLDCTIDMAIERGTFPTYDKSIEEKDNKWFSFVKENFPTEYERLLTYGRRNVNTGSVAPQGSGSLMTMTTSGIEPVFCPYYERKRKVTSMDETYDEVDEVGEKFRVYVVTHPGLGKFAKTKYPDIDLKTLKVADWEKIYKESPYYGSCSHELSWKKRLDIQSIIQKYIGMSISITINLHKDTKVSEIEELYLYAWEKGVKGTTIYRDGCRSGVLNTLGNSGVKKGDDKPLKRPKYVDADLHNVKVKGETFSVVVGLIEGKPYEVFAFRPTTDLPKRVTAGKIVKVSKGKYEFESDGLTENLMLTSDSIEEKATTIYTSMLLRHNVPINYIVRTTKKVNDNMISFSSALCRVLSKYIKNGEVTGDACPECGGKLVFEDGCKHCSECSYSAC